MGRDNSLLAAAAAAAAAVDDNDDLDRGGWRECETDERTNEW